LATVGVKRPAARGSPQFGDRALDGLPRLAIDDAAGYADDGDETASRKNGERREHGRRAQQSSRTVPDHQSIIARMFFGPLLL
jgi:hypothetical protein